MFRKFAVAALVCAGMTGIAYAATVGAGGMRSTELQRSEVPGGNYVVITLRTEMDSGAMDPLHSHPGVQIGYLEAGSLLLKVEGQPDRLIKAGESYQVPAGVPHAGINTGSDVYKSVTSYVVDKTKPLRTELAK